LGKVLMGYRPIVERFVVAVQEQTYGFCECRTCQRSGMSPHPLPRTILEAAAAAERELAGWSTPMRPPNSEHDTPPTRRRLHDLEG
jgi:hypothetical protein